MTLRTRLIMAFLVLSVAPLGTATYFSYASQVRALQDLAARETDELSTEMTQRMQLVTTELSARVEQLAEMNQPEAVRVSNTRPASSTPSPPTVQVSEAPVPAQAEPTTAGQVVNALTRTVTAVDEGRIVEALGAAAALLQTVELQGMRGRGERPPLPVGQTRPEGNGRAGGEPRPQGQRGAVPPRFRNTQRPGDPNAPPRPPLPPREGRGTSPAPGPGAPAEPPAEGGATAPSEDRVVIDMGAIARDMFRQYLPEGGFEKMTPEQRQQIARDVNLRMTGIAEGIKLGAAELARRATEARGAQASAEASGAPPAAAPPPAAPPAPPAAPDPVQVPDKPITRSTTLVGNKLDVKLMQDGEMVGQVNATVDLDNLLATVFSPTRRERGEVPFAVGPDGKVYTLSDEDRRVVDDLGPIARPDGPLGKTVLRDWIVVTSADPSGSGLRFGIARPVGDSLDALRRTVARNAGFGLLLIGIAIVGVVPLSGRLTRDLSSLTAGVERIANGDYRARVPVRRRDEVGDLASAFNKMAEDVERHQHAAIEQERLRRELELGRQIQSDMLPRAPMNFGLTEVQGVSIPAREVGGDFFNYFALDNGRVALLVGDVSGKGVGAALLMANIQASLRTRLGIGQNLSAIADALDREMGGTGGSRLYSTLFLGIFDPVTRRLEYVNAGHNPQFVLRPGQPLQRMEATGMPVGLYAGQGYTHREVTLEAGDLLFFYTDGCVETENAADDMFGAERLEALLVSLATSASDGPSRVLERVESALARFRGTREPNDDATMMAVRIG